MQVDMLYLGLACMSSRMYVRHVQIDWLGLHDDLACWLVVVGLHDSVAACSTVRTTRTACLDGCALFGAKPSFFCAKFGVVLPLPSEIEVRCQSYHHGR